MAGYVEPPELALLRTQVSQLNPHAMRDVLQSVASAVTALSSKFGDFYENNATAHNNITGLITALDQRLQPIESELLLLRSQHDGLQRALTERFVPLENKAETNEARSGVLAQVISSLADSVNAAHKDIADRFGVVEAMFQQSSPQGLSAIDVARLNKLEGDVQGMITSRAQGVQQHPIQESKVLSACAQFKDFGKLGQKDVHYVEWTGGFLTSLDELRPGAMQLLHEVRKLNDKELKDLAQISDQGWGPSKLERFSSELYSLLLKSTTG